MPVALGKMKVAHSATFTVVPAVTTTWNPNDKAAAVTLSGGNLTAQASAGVASYNAVRTIVGEVGKKCYWEATVGAGTVWGLGFGHKTASLTNFVGGDIDGWGWFSTAGGLWNNNALQATYSTYTTGDILNFAIDDVGRLYIGKNGTWQNSGNPAAGAGSVATFSGVVYAMLSNGSSTSVGAATANFGAGPFSYAVPSGFSGLY